MIKTDDFFEERHVDASQQGTKVVRGRLFWKKRTAEDVSYTQAFLACKLCDWKIELWIVVRSPSRQAHWNVRTPDNLPVIKETHALRHQMAGEFPQ